MTTKKAIDLTLGDKITHCSSRVEYVEVIPSSTMVRIHFQHSWVEPLVRFRNETVTLES